MSAINVGDILPLVGIVFYVFATGFSFYLPIRRRWGETIALCLGIPASLAIITLLSYVFYCWRRMELFFPTYVVVVLVCNGWDLYGSLRERSTTKRRATPTWWMILLTLLLVIPVVVTRFWDAFSTTAPGHPDTFYHIEFLQNLAKTGTLGLAYYAPGFHTWIYPLFREISIEYFYRFTGPAIGLLVAVGAFLLFKTFIKTVWARVVLVLLGTAPLFASLTLQTIGLWPSAISILYVAAFFYLTAMPTDLSARARLGFYALLTVGIALTVPYVFVQYIPALGALWVLVWIFRKRFGKEYWGYLFRLLVISCAGLVLAIGHVVLQTRVLAQVERGFPEISQTVERDGQLILTTNYQNTTVSSGNTGSSTVENAHEERGICKKIRDYLDKQPLYRDYIEPLLTTGKSLLEVKNFRPWSNPTSHRVYYWLLFSIGLTVYAVWRKDRVLLMVGVVSILLSISMQTGILEMAAYRGRVGWYLSLITILTLAIVCDRLYRPWQRIPLGIICILLYAWSLCAPPVFERQFNKEVFRLAYQAVQENGGQPITFITDQVRLQLLSDKVTVAPLTQGEVEHVRDGKQFVIFGDQVLDALTEYDRQALTNDQGTQLAEQERQAANASLHQREMGIQNSIFFTQNYRLYAQSGELGIYRYTGQ